MRANIEPRKNDIYLIAGAFWISSRYTEGLFYLKNRGVLVGLIVYDLIPITHPQFVDAATRDAVLIALSDVMLVADFALTISEHVARELSTVLDIEFDRSIPVLSVPLAHELMETMQGTTVHEKKYDKNLIKGEFVLCICTIEGRKNHLLLFNIWKALLRQLGPKTPALVVVGKWGWKFEEFRQALTSSHFLDGKIIVINDATDKEISNFYRNCLFTIFPSFVEGWGLPVGESLAFGKLCVASSTSSIPEVGRDFCRYIDPYDPLASLLVVKELIENKEKLLELEKKIKDEFVMRKWSEYTDDLLNSLLYAASQADGENCLPVQLMDRIIYIINKNELYKINKPWKDRIIKFIFVNNWHEIDDECVWSSDTTARIVFQTRFIVGTVVNVALRMQKFSNSIEVLTRLKSGEKISIVEIKITPSWFYFDVIVSSNGSVEIEIECYDLLDDKSNQESKYIGVSGVVFNEKDDVEGRLRTLERVISGAKQ